MISFLFSPTILSYFQIKYFINLTSKQEKPFLEIKNGIAHGNERYQGYIPDFIKLLSEELGFKYILTLVKDGLYGDFDHDGNWNGMIGEVVRQVCRTFKDPFTSRDCDVAATSLPNPINCFGVVLLHQVTAMLLRCCW